MYRLALDTPDSSPHSQFIYETLDDAKNEVEKAIRMHYLAVAGGITIVTGPGTIYKIVSDEYAEADEAWQRGPARDYTLVVVVRHAQLQPMTFDTEQEMVNAVDRAIRNHILVHVGREGHDHNYVQMCPGTTFMRMATVEFEQKQRQLAQQMGQNLSDVPRIVLPGKN